MGEEKGIDLRGFTLGYDEDVRSGYVLRKLMEEAQRMISIWTVSTMLRGKLTHLDEVYDQYPGVQLLLGPASRASLGDSEVFVLLELTRRRLTMVALFP